jgi:hypothetical protein
MVVLGVILIIGAVVVALIGVSFVYDIRQGVGPDATGGSVDPHSGRTYTFLRVRGVGVAWIVTILTFVIAAVLLIVGIVLLFS